MSYDLAVWDGERPADDKIAARLQRPVGPLRRRRGATSPSERLAAYVAVRLERWCALTEDDEELSPGRPDR